MASILGIGKAAPGAMLLDALSHMNRMLSMWSTKSNAIHYVTRESFALVASDGDYSFGTGGNFNSARPVEILDGCTVTVNSVEYPVRIETRENYDKLAIKTTTGIPYMLYYEPTYPTGTVRLYFVPNSNYTLNLKSLKPFSTYGISDSMNLPDGYEFAITYALAMMLGDMVGKPLSQLNVKLATESMAWLESVNFSHRVPTIDTIDGSPFKKHGRSSRSAWFGF